jgi:hypothetical protein
MAALRAGEQAISMGADITEELIGGNMAAGRTRGTSSTYRSMAAGSVADPGSFSPDPDTELSSQIWIPQFITTVLVYEKVGPFSPIS